MRVEGSHHGQLWHDGQLPAFKDVVKQACLIEYKGETNGTSLDTDQSFDKNNDDLSVVWLD
jgi:hypothetical protein